jgi:hypothetical protein
MSVYIDRKFLHLLSPKLERFAQKKQDLYNFRCPICGDSQTKKSKARGYIFRKANDYFFMCHNCGASHTLYNFIKFVDPSLLQEYALERFKNGETGNHNYTKPKFDEFKVKPTFKESIQLPTVAELPDGHFCKQYVINRKIPVEFHSQLYYADDFKSFVESMQEEKSGLVDDDKRLVIPFYDKDKSLIAFQGRALGESKIRYVTITLRKDVTKFFGLNKVDPNKKVYVVEGPIDSMFIPNAIATADSNLTRANELGFNDVTYIFDNEPRNKEIVKTVERAIKEGNNVCLLPESIKEKDINDMILSGRTIHELLALIDNFTYSKLRAELEFSNWKRI